MTALLLLYSFLASLSAFLTKSLGKAILKVCVCIQVLYINCMYGVKCHPNNLLILGINIQNHFCKSLKAPLTKGAFVPPIMDKSKNMIKTFTIPKFYHLIPINNSSDPTRNRNLT